MDKEYDVVNNPEHYTSSKFECIDVMEAVFGKTMVLSFCLLNAFKYIFRCMKKHKSPIEDIKKSIWYLNRYIKIYEKGANQE